MNNKHAYLVIAHNHMWQLKKLLSLLDDKRNDIFLHIDPKVGEISTEQLYSACQNSRLYVYQEISVGWGGFPDQM